MGPDNDSSLEKEVDMIELALAKDKHTYIFQCPKKRYELLLADLLEKSANPESGIGAFDAEVISYYLSCKYENKL